MNTDPSICSSPRKPIQFRLRSLLALITATSLSLATAIQYQRYRNWNEFLAVARITGIHPLISACDSGKLDYVKRLLDAGTSPNLICDQFHSPLATATCNADLQITRLLLERGADPNQPRQGDGFSPLHLAASGRMSTKFVQLLVKHGADVNGLTRHDNPETALHLLCKPSFGSMSRGDRSDIDLDWVNSLVEHGADVDACDSLGRSPLFLAVVHRRALIVKRLIERGARVNILDDKGDSPLSLALTPSRDDRGRPLMVGYDPQIVEMLLKAKASPNLGREPPIIAAVKHRQPEVAAMLLWRGANPHAKNNHGETPLSAAMKRSERDLFLEVLSDHENGMPALRVSENTRP